jgi:hypothetical protein
MARSIQGTEYWQRLSQDKNPEHKADKGTRRRLLSEEDEAKGLM